MALSTRVFSPRILFQVPSEFARLTFDLLKTHGACIEYHEDRDMDHRLGDRSVFFLKKWIETHSSGAKPAVL